MVINNEIWRLKTDMIKDADIRMVVEQYVRKLVLIMPVDTAKRNETDSLLWDQVWNAYKTFADSDLVPPSLFYEYLLANGFQTFVGDCNYNLTWMVSKRQFVRKQDAICPRSCLNEFFCVLLHHILLCAQKNEYDKRNGYCIAGDCRAGTHRCRCVPAAPCPTAGTRVETEE